MEEIVKKIQKKKGVTLVALVITIIIMLLLAGVVMQMALGDNGLIAKVSQSKIEQARAELYETAKIEYLSLKTKAIEKDEEEPPVNDVLSASGFLAKYDVNEDDITDKKGEVIGPAECPIFMTNNNYRYQLLLRSDNIAVLQKNAENLLYNYTHAQSVYIECDVDPVSIM